VQDQAQSVRVGQRFEDLRAVLDVLGGRREP
jgi:hypothetical protein